MIRRPPRSTPFPTRRSSDLPDGKKICISRTREKPNEYHCTDIWVLDVENDNVRRAERMSFDQANSSSPSWSKDMRDRKSTRLNSSHQIISYAVFCLKKKNYD